MTPVVRPSGTDTVCRGRPGSVGAAHDFVAPNSGTGVVTCVP